jgi:hypothetical protein
MGSALGSVYCDQYMEKGTVMERHWEIRVVEEDGILSLREITFHLGQPYMVATKQSQCFLTIGESEGTWRSLIKKACELPTIAYPFNKFVQLDLFDNRG